LGRTGEGNDAAQIGFRAIVSVAAMQIIRTFLKRTFRNYCRTSQL
jgi:ribose 5-phosphate isomerase RpiB